MKKTIFIIFLLVIFLSACVSVLPDVNIQNTVIAIAQTGIVQTETAKPTVTPTLIATATLILPTPSPLPTQPPIFIITPNAIQVEKWREYEIALSRSLLPNFPTSLVLCEWVILGQSDLKQEIYMLAVCGMDGASSFLPAVIYLNSDDSIKKVQKVDYGSSFEANFQLLFPSEIQDIVYSNFTRTVEQQLSFHLNWRLSNPGYPPLIMISYTPSP